MTTVASQEALVKLPAEALQESLEQFLTPVTDLLPDKRLRRVSVLAVQGICSGLSAAITEMARGVAHEQKSVWPLAKRFYRFLYNRRCRHQRLLHGLYRIAQQTVAQYKPAYLVLALDPVNFEKPYTKKLEGISTVYKATPPALNGKARLTPGYPAITATIVNLPMPAITYANWFSYTTQAYGDHNRHLYRAIRMSHTLFPQERLRFVGDSGLDDLKIFSWVEHVGGQFIIRAEHNRRIEVYNERLERWESELLEDLTGSVPLPVVLRTCFTHARKVRIVDLKLGWLRLRWPESHKPLWALVIQDPDKAREIVLLTNVPITCAQEAQHVYRDWSHRPQIEHVYRLDQEEGLDIETLRVRTIERMRRVMALVMLGALFVYYLDQSWPQAPLAWLRYLGGKLGLSQDRDGPYMLLAGIRAVFLTAATLTFARCHPFEFCEFELST